jgi:hypothetical protein
VRMVREATRLEAGTAVPALVTHFTASAPASVTEPASHEPSQVLPAAQSSIRFPLHSMWHGEPGPHSTRQPALPVQSAVQPPLGHLISQVLLPWHDSVLPVSRVMVQSLPPPQVT